MLRRLRRPPHLHCRLATLGRGCPSCGWHAAPAAPVVAREINGLAIFWALLKSWFGGLVGKKA